MHITGLLEVILYVRDMACQVAFYRDTIGLEISYPVGMAAFFGHPKAVAFLVESGAEINARSQDGRTPLDFAREKHQAAMIEFLQKHSAID